MFPYDRNRQLITQQYDAINYMASVERNTIEQLRGLLSQPSLCTTASRAIEISQASDKKSLSSGSLNREKYLNLVEVRLGQSNDFIHQLVRDCWKAGMTDAGILEFVERVYERGKRDKRITCKDGLSSWKAKAKGRLKHYRKLKPLDAAWRAAFYRSDFEWLIKNCQEPNDDRFLACHLWGHRKSIGKPYPLSYEKIRELCGMSHNSTSQKLKRFIRDGVIKQIEPGEKGPRKQGGSRAAVYELVSPPTSEDGHLEDSEVMDFVYAFREALRSNHRAC